MHPRNGLADMLIIVSTHNRPGITGLCLYNLLRNKSPESKVTVMDDHSTLMSDVWFKNFGFELEKVPDGKHYAIAKLEYFLASKHEFLLSLDSDMFVAQDFDLKISKAWMSAIRHYYFGGGYISRLHDPKDIERHDTFCLIPSTIGGCLFLSRILAKKLLDELQLNSGTLRMYDPIIKRMSEKIVCPPASVVQHIGIYEGQNTDMNNISGEYADDFLETFSVGPIKL